MEPNTAQQIWAWIGNHLWLFILGIPSIIQIVPIKINPWTAVIKWVGKIITNDACSKMDDILTKINKIDQLETKIDNLKTEVNDVKWDAMTNEKDRIRWEILDFANSCHNGRRHTKDEFRHIDKLNKKYIELLKKTNDTNGEFDMEYKYIQALYEERTRKNDFLQNKEGL